MLDKMGLADQNQPARKTYENIHSNTADACLLAADKQYFSDQIIKTFLVIVNMALSSSPFFFKQVKPRTEFRLIIFYNYTSLREQVVQD